MLKSKFVFAVSLALVLTMGAAYATDPDDTTVTTDTVATEHAVYDAASNTGTATTLNAASGIAGVTYVNRMVNAAGNAAQLAENHAAAAGAYAIAAKDAADAAQATADNVANKQDSSTAVTHGASTAVGSANRPVYVASTGAATAVTGMSIPVGGETGTTWASIWVE